MMVRELNLYVCEECMLVYEKKETAESCEKWCKKNKSCNIEFVKEAIGKQC